MTSEFESELIPGSDEGWVDALCNCSNPDNHAGEFCPDRDKEPINKSSSYGQEEVTNG